MIKATSLLILCLLMVPAAAVASTWPDHLSVRTYRIDQGSTRVLRISIAEKDEDRRKGLTGVLSKDFPKDRGMLFVFGDFGDRQIHMAGTHVNLDVFFLNQKECVIDLHRGMKADPRNSDIGKTTRSKVSPAFFVLELRSDSPLAIGLRKGSCLKPVFQGADLNETPGT